MSKFDVAIISIYPFPLGGAATNRILSYSKGLINADIEVDIYIPISTDYRISTELHEDTGCFQGINYFYTSGRYRSRIKLLRGLSRYSKLRKLRGYLTIYYELIRKSRRKKYKIIIISTDEILSLITYSILAKLIGSKPVFIFDEFPIPIRHKLKNKLPLWKIIGYTYVLRYLNGYISISEKLSHFYNEMQKKKTFIMPVIVDLTRFQNLTSVGEKSENIYRYLTYMGNMELSKDNVDLIIIAFSKIENRFNDIRLNLFGHANKRDLTRITNLIDKLNLKDKVHLKGRVDSNLVPEILSKSFILVSSQPNTLRASGGFPTKLGEYLASGVPTLITDVGENSKYVKDGVHCFFALPNNIENYASRLEFIIENYQDALEVASNGKRFIFNVYSHINVGNHLANYLAEL